MFLLLHRLLNSGKDNEPVNSTILAARPAADINMFLFPMLIQIYSAEACKTFLKKGRPLFLQRFPDKIKTGDYGKAGGRRGGGGVSPPKLPCRWELHSGWHCSQVWKNKKNVHSEQPPLEMQGECLREREAFAYDYTMTWIFFYHLLQI